MDEKQLKIALSDAPFKAVFKATIAFYIAQTLMTIAGIAALIGAGLVAYLVLS